MATISERRQHLDFDASWQAMKWDVSDECMTGIQATGLEGVKAADVVAARAEPGWGLIVAEFKDFANPNIPLELREEKAQQAVSDKLIGDLVRKIIDTLCGATFSSASTGRQSTAIHSWRRSVGHARSKLLVLFCIEVPPSQAIATLAWTKKLQKQMRWLGSDARIIVTSGHRPFSGHGVAYRLDPPARRAT